MAYLNEILPINWLVPTVQGHLIVGDLFEITVHANHQTLFLFIKGKSDNLVCRMFFVL